MSALWVSSLLVGLPLLAAVVTLAVRRWPGPATQVSVVASLVADLAWFWAGRRFGYPVLRFLCRVSLSPDTCVRQTEGIFERWGFFSVVLSKFVPGFATVAPPIAGALRMPVMSFVAASAASAALWVGAAMLVGFLFAAEIDAVLGWMRANFAIAAAAIGAAVLIRALEPLAGIGLMHERRGVADEEQLCSGPGKLTQALGIELDLNGTDAIAGPLRVGPRPPGWEEVGIVIGTRIGITKAADLPWRFCERGSRWISGVAPSRTRPRRG